MLFATVDTHMRQMLQSEMRSAQDVKWYRRLKVINLPGQGTAVLELARMFDLNPATIRSYIRAFNTHGLDGIRPSYGQGRPLALDWTAEQWLDVLSQAPGHLELLNTAARNWTQALLREYLLVYHQVHLSQSALSKSFHRVGLRWRRAKLRVHSPDPLYIVKRQRVAELQQMALSGSLTRQMAAHPRSDEPPRRRRVWPFWTAPTCIGVLTSALLMAWRVGNSRLIRLVWPIPGRRFSGALSIRPVKGSIPFTNANEPPNS